MWEPSGLSAQLGLGGKGLRAIYPVPPPMKQEEYTFV